MIIMQPYDEGETSPNMTEAVRGALRVGVRGANQLWRLAKYLPLRKLLEARLRLALVSPPISMD